MKTSDPGRDRVVGDALRHLAPAPVTPHQRRLLARRILERATPLLDARGGVRLTWWDYAAAWAGTLIPVGVAMSIAAAACLVWVSVDPVPAPPSSRATEHAALLRAVTNSAPSPQLVDFVLAAPSADAAAESR